MPDLLDTKSFGAACIGAVTLGTGYVAGISDSALLVVPVAVMIVYWLNSGSRPLSWLALFRAKGPAEESGCWLLDAGLFS